MAFAIEEQNSKEMTSHILRTTHFILTPCTMHTYCIDMHTSHTHLTHSLLFVRLSYIQLQQFHMKNKIIMTITMIKSYRFVVIHPLTAKRMLRFIIFIIIFVWLRPDLIFRSDSNKIKSTMVVDKDSLLISFCSLDA